MSGEGGWARTVRGKAVRRQVGRALALWLNTVKMTAGAGVPEVRLMEAVGCTPMSGQGKAIQWCGPLADRR